MKNKYQKSYIENLVQKGKKPFSCWLSSDTLKKIKIIKSHPGYHFQNNADIIEKIVNNFLDDIIN